MVGSIQGPKNYPTDYKSDKNSLVKIFIQGLEKVMYDQEGLKSVYAVVLLWSRSRSVEGKKVMFFVFN